MATRELKESTRVNYLRIWDNRVKDEVGNIKVVQMKIIQSWIVWQ